MNEILLGGSVLIAVAAVAYWSWRHAKPTDVTKIAAEQLRQARIFALEHRAAYEQHKALADMYDLRVRRLDPQTAIPDTAYMPLGSK